MSDPDLPLTTATPVVIGQTYSLADLAPFYINYVSEIEPGPIAYIDLQLIEEPYLTFSGGVEGGGVLEYNIAGKSPIFAPSLSLGTVTFTSPGEIFGFLAFEPPDNITGGPATPVTLDFTFSTALFTSGADTVDFNNLMPEQQAAIAAGAETTDGLGGGDTVTLPTSGDVAFTDGDGNNTITAGSGNDTITITGNGANKITIGFGTDDVTINGTGANTISAGTGSAGITITNFSGKLTGSAPSPSPGATVKLTGADSGNVTIGSNSTVELSAISTLNGPITFGSASGGTLRLDQAATTITTSEGTGPISGTGSETINVSGGGTGNITGPNSNYAVSLAGSHDTITINGDGNNTVTGTVGTDTITIAGNGVNNIDVSSATGFDRLTATGTGNVEIIGGNFGNAITGGSGNDFLEGGNGSDTFNGVGVLSTDAQRGNDEINGASYTTLDSSDAVSFAYPRASYSIKFLPTLTLSDGSNSIGFGAIVSSNVGTDTIANWNYLDFPGKTIAETDLSHASVLAYGLWSLADAFGQLKSYIGLSQKISDPRLKTIGAWFDYADGVIGALAQVATESDKDFKSAISVTLTQAVNAVTTPFIDRAKSILDERIDDLPMPSSWRTTAKTAVDSGASDLSADISLATVALVDRVDSVSRNSFSTFDWSSQWQQWMTDVEQAIKSTYGLFDSGDPEQEWNDPETLTPQATPTPINAPTILWQGSNGQAAVWNIAGTNVSGGGPVSADPGPSWHAVETGDFFGGGSSDILWQNPSTGQASIWEMNGNTLLGGGPVSPNPGPSWRAVGTGDFNGDGLSDILWQNTSSGQASIWEMSGNSLIGGGPVTPNPGPAWKAIGTGDFNDDGLSDILWQNTSSGQVSIWEMSGNTLIGGGPVSANPGPAWQAIGTGDFNDDGLSDILFQNTSTGQVSIWEMNGNTLIGGGPVSANPGTSWHATGTGAGGSDILLQNASGQTSIWEMNGNTIIGGGPVSANPGPSWRAVGLT